MESWNIEKRRISNGMRLKRKLYSAFRCRLHLFHHHHNHYHHQCCLKREKKSDLKVCCVISAIDVVKFPVQHHHTILDTHSSKKDFLGAELMIYWLWPEISDRRRELCGPLFKAQNHLKCYFISSIYIFHFLLIFFCYFISSI